MGCRQVVRHMVLVHAFGGSNPSTPAIEKDRASPLSFSISWSGSEPPLLPIPLVLTVKTGYHIRMATKKTTTKKPAVRTAAKKTTAKAATSRAKTTKAKKPAARKTTTRRTQSTKVDYYPNRVALLTATAAVLILLALGMITAL